MHVAKSRHRAYRIVLKRVSSRLDMRSNHGPCTNRRSCPWQGFPSPPSRSTLTRVHALPPWWRHARPRMLRWVMRQSLETGTVSGICTRIWCLFSNRMLVEVQPYMQIFLRYMNVYFVFQYHFPASAYMWTITHFIVQSRAWFFTHSYAKKPVPWY